MFYIIIHYLASYVNPFSTSIVRIELSLCAVFAVSSGHTAGISFEAVVLHSVDGSLLLSIDPELFASLKWIADCRFEAVAKLPGRKQIKDWVLVDRGMANLAR